MNDIPIDKIDTRALVSAIKFHSGNIKQMRLNIRVPNRDITYKEHAKLKAEKEAVTRLCELRAWMRGRQHRKVRRIQTLLSTGDHQCVTVPFTKQDQAKVVSGVIRDYLRKAPTLA